MRQEEEPFGMVMKAEDGSEQYTPAKADQIAEDGGKVKLGDVMLTAHITPGHSKGCTTWTTTVEEDGKQ